MKNNRVVAIIVSVMLICLIWFLPNIVGNLFPNAPATPIVDSFLGRIVARMIALFFVYVLVAAMFGEFLMYVRDKIREVKDRFFG